MNFLRLHLLEIYLILGMTGIEMVYGKIHIPPEWEPHNRTYMVWPASPAIWRGSEFLQNVRNDIAQIAKAIAKYEPVFLIADPSQAEEAQKFFVQSGAESPPKYNITIIQFPVDDLWARDTLPVFGIDQDTGSVVGVDFNFNGWGGKQEHEKDAELASKLLKSLNLTRIKTELVGEGGSLEFDGDGTLLLTESSIVNENRNPNYDRNKIEQELKALLGIEKVIWFEGLKGKDITDYHVDSVVRFARPGVVILNRPAAETPQNIWTKSSDDIKKILESETDAKGRKFQIVELVEPHPDKIIIKGEAEEFLSSYVNFLVTNGGVILPEFGDKEADEEAKKVIRGQFPGRDVVGVKISYLASGGGGIHCATHDLPTSGGGRLDPWSSGLAGALLVGLGVYV